MCVLAHAPFDKKVDNNAFMTENFSFDKRVAHLYNQQRAHPPEVARQIGEAITAQAGAGAQVLEIGVGTGRIAVPVAMAGCHVTGIDLSAEMLSEAVEMGEGGGSLRLARADMHHLPFCDDAFNGVTVVHVLHLAKDWQVVLREVGRVLRSDGAFIQGDDWIDPKSVVGMIRDELRRHVAKLSPGFVPPSAGVSRQQVLADLGGTETTELIAAEWTTYVSALDRLETVERRIDAESWILPDELFNTVLAHLREYAAAHWPDLEEKQPVTRRFVLKVTRGNW